METGQNESAACDAKANLHERVRQRAEELYVESGRVPGRDLENWSRAEREIQAQAETGKQNMAVVIKVNGVKYVGEYESELADGYTPGEFAAGSTVTVRMVRDRMFIKRANGKELETRIVRRMH